MLTLALIALALLPVRSLAATVSNVTIPHTGTVFVPCTGELVDYSGTEHQKVSVTTDSNGGTHLAVDGNIHVTATGEDSGNTYIGNHEYQMSENFTSGGTITMTEQPLTLEVVSKGSAPNWLLHFLFHLTVNPDGTTTSFIDTVSAECR